MKTASAGRFTDRRPPPAEWQFTHGLIDAVSGRGVRPAGPRRHQAASRLKAAAARESQIAAADTRAPPSRGAIFRRLTQFPANMCSYATAAEVIDLSAGAFSVQWNARRGEVSCQ